MTTYKEARIAAGIPSQRKAAHLMGVDLTQYRRWEEGDHVPMAGVIAKMARCFGFTAGQVLGLEPLPEAPVASTPAAS